MTSVQWLDEKLQDIMYIQYGYVNGVRKIVIPLEDYMKFKQQANKMFEQQIIDAHDMGYIDGGNHKKVTAEQYYNETYGSKGSGKTKTDKL